MGDIFHLWQGTDSGAGSQEEWDSGTGILVVLEAVPSSMISIRICGHDLRIMLLLLYALEPALESRITCW